MLANRSIRVIRSVLPATCSRIVFNRISNNNSINNPLYSNNSNIYSANRLIHSTNIIKAADNDTNTNITDDDPRNSVREEMIYDVLIVGGGPAGLSAAIRLKQLAAKNNIELSVCIVEKGTEIGSHILSGNVFEPRALNELFPDWSKLSADERPPLTTAALVDKLYYLTAKHALPLPTPPSLHNNGNYIISLGALCKWLAQQAESLGVEIYPGFAASEVLFDSNNNNTTVIGIATTDNGISKSGQIKSSYTRGIALKAKQTLFAEGARGSCSESLINKYSLRTAANADPQTYGLGLKEVWEIPPEQHKEGTIIHSIGWPAPSDIWFGSFLYHSANNQIFIGTVTGLDYSNPYISPYQLFQQFKLHPTVSAVLKGGKCISYGGRVINEGGLQSIPKLTFPGGLLIGCSAGFLNVPKIKGSHTAMKSGILAADTIINTIIKSTDKSIESINNIELTEYESAVRSSWINDELYSVRNIHPSFHSFGGLYGFSIYSALESFLFKGRVPWTLHNKLTDEQHTKPASQYKPIEYPKPDNILTFDLLTNLQRSGVNHEEDQPSHLRIKSELSTAPVQISYKQYAAPETRFCPAKVYEFINTDTAEPKLQINQSNCIHCKTCDIKTPANYIKWTVPEGGGGPNYQNM